MKMQSKGTVEIDRTSFMKRFLLFAIIAALGITSLQLRAQNALPPELPAQQAARSTISRPRYALRADIDMKLLTFTGSANIQIPVATGDAMNDAVFFIFANAGGVGGDDARVQNIAVSSVRMNGIEVPFTLEGAVLRARLPQPQRNSFALDIAFHGVVPRAPQGAGGLAEMMGGIDLGGLFGGAPGGAKPKPKNIDYGLYSYGDGVLSLGSFWYPTLAVRKAGKWIDEAPEGLGDVAYAESSDYSAVIIAPQNMKIAATGTDTSALYDAPSPGADKRAWLFTANRVRDFSVAISEDFVTKSKTFEVGGKPVTVESFTTKAHAAKGDAAIAIAGRALQIYAKRFGPYPYSSFKVVEGPIRGGAGGMEYSGMTTIASMLYGDLGKELGGLADALGAPGVDSKALENLIGDDDAPGDAKGTVEKAPENQNPAADLLGSLLGGQKEILDSLFEMTIAHEVAHQWWAIGVGSDSQRAPWLDESLTNYSAIVYFEDRYGKARAARMMDAHLKTSYSMVRMLGQKDAPVNLRTSAYEGNAQYGGIVYGKGALFYEALRQEIGDAAFFGALHDYYAAQSGKLAAPPDLLRAFVARAPQQKTQIAALWKRWIEETHGDEDITGGAPTGLADMLGGLLGGGEE
jgi:hypothetical protein